MKNSHARIYDALFVLVLLVAACFRLVGLNWDQSQHLHPDERFMTMVETGMSPVTSISDYFNTDSSTLNPHNVGYGFYVYGDLPILIVRYIADWMTSVSVYAAQNVHAVGGPDSLLGHFYAWLSQTPNWAGYDQVTLVGRAFSAFADLGTIFLLYLIAARIYGRKVALLAAAFASVAVMEIQQSHFFTVDNFANFFMFLTTYFAVEIGFRKAGTENWASVETTQEPEAEDDSISMAGGELQDSQKPAKQDFISSTLQSALFWNTVGFGIALGMSVASKISAAPLAVLLPVALVIRYFRQRAGSDQDTQADAPTPEQAEQVPTIEQASIPKFGHDVVNKPLQPAHLSIPFAVILLVIGAFFSLLSFRVFQPYAFPTPSLTGSLNSDSNAVPTDAPLSTVILDKFLNPKWVANIQEQQNQATGDVDFPPALQWARRSKLFSLENIVDWGLGWPLGILACLGFLYMGWRVLRGEWKEHILLWSWTAFYFVWQSLQWNSTMRYQLPIYPLLALMAAWLALRAFEHIEHKPQAVADNDLPGEMDRPDRWSSISKLPKFGHDVGQDVVHALPRVMPIVGVVVLIATGIWAYAFIHIYMVDHSRVQATRWIYQNVPGPINLEISRSDKTLYSQPLPYQTSVIAPATPYDTQFTANASGTIQSIVLGHAVDPVQGGVQTVTILLASDANVPADKALARATLTADLAPKTDPRGESYTLNLDRPVTVEKAKNYFLHFETTGALTLTGSAPINESSWDDGLPLRMDGYDAFGGLYDGNHNFEMYWDDNADKLARFTSNLDTGDYVFISSNRQWATTTRVPERYPLTTLYYRDLIGCPANKDVIWCYNVATPGMFTGSLGYDLVQVFESFPTIGPWRINDQFADEAFTVYDHPKALIFKKRADYNAAQVHAILGAVDLSKVVHLTPLKASSYRAMDLMLPANQLKAQRAGGTWSEMFSYESLLNKYPFLGLLVWYLALSLLGLFTYLFLRLILPGLSDRGYPLARLSGLLLLAYFAWIVGSLGGTYSRLTIGIGAGLIIIGGLVAGWARREELVQEIRSRGRYFLSVEGIFLAFFLIDLLIRLGNPDLWHPYKGGERPMDFSYLNAVIKSTSFPPYDPWFAGGYINYYYWGFVLVGTPIKLLGIVPSIAYNFVLPTLFALVAIGGFSVAWNLLEGVKLKFSSPHEAELVQETEPAQVADSPVQDENETGEKSVTPYTDRTFNLQWLSGIAAGVGLVLVGNLGTIQMIFHGLQRMIVPGDTMEAPDVSIIQHWAWAVQGVGKLFTGQPLPFYPGDWYWVPSRALPPGPGNEITEFPLFTFLYSDLHAHMLALPLTLLAIGWALSVLMARNMSRWTWLGSLVFGGLVIGALRPTNTWDFPTYLTLGALVTGYAIFRYANIGDTPRLGASPTLQRIFLALVGMGLLVGFSVLFYQPFANWYALGYSSFTQWNDPKTPIWSYWVHWGLFLFVIVSWMTWETRQWLAQTPFSEMAKLKPYLGLIQLAIGLMIAVIAILIFVLKATIAWFIMPLAFWALILMLRPGLPDVKRLVLFMIGTGLAITMVVEIIVLDGDIGRQNTIFKFYMQAWVLFAVSSAAGLGWLAAEIHEWTNGWRNFWYTAGALFLAGALLFTFTATFDKIQDRMSPNVPPLTLDSMTYMQYSTFNENGTDLDLSHDYRAIRWMQDNIKGSPVIAEANSLNLYRWFARYTIYTGLPDVVGWDWHQRQQRAILPGELVTNRVNATIDFYNTTDIDSAKTFLQAYAVKYIVVGQLESVSYTAEGLAKFAAYNGKLWKEIYHDGDTTIYEVLQ